MSRTRSIAHFGCGVLFSLSLLVIHTACGSDTTQSQDDTNIPGLDAGVDSDTTPSLPSDDEDVDSGQPGDDVSLPGPGNNDTGKDPDVSEPLPDPDPPTPSNPTSPGCPEDCGEGMLCVRNQCVFNSCAWPYEMGTVTTTEAVTISNIPSSITTIRPTCLSHSNSTGEEVVYSFSVASSGRATFRLNSDEDVNWVYEIRKGQCEDPQSDEDSEGAEPEVISNDHIVSCVQYANVNHQVNLEANTEYFLIIQTPYSQGTGFTMDISLESTVCQANSRICGFQDPETILVCSASSTTQSVESCHGSCMIQGCGGVDCCHGNTCDNAIDVQFSDANPVVVFEGNQQAYTSAVNFSSMSFTSDSSQICKGKNIATPGADMYFHLRNIKAGDEVIIDTINKDQANFQLPANRNRNTIYVSTNCPMTAGTPLACVGFSNSHTHPYRWTAPTDGDFFVTIDTSMTVENSFIYRICKGECPLYQSQ